MKKMSWSHLAINSLSFMQKMKNLLSQKRLKIQQALLEGGISYNNFFIATTCGYNLFHFQR